MGEERMAKLQQSVFVLFLTVSLTIPAMGMTVTPKNAQLSTWLYVGGSGPGNYTTIQAAVDAAMDGDTVFVYDDSSPYREQVLINRSITLLGEQRQTTILNGTAPYPGPYSPLIRILADNVTISSFTLLTISNGFEMEIYTNNNHISDMSFERSGYGIFISDESMSTPLLQGNTIEHSFFIDNEYGIRCIGIRKTTIAHNDFQGNTRGVVLGYAHESNVSSNVISDAETCIVDQWGYHNTFQRNTMNHSSLGMAIDMCKDLVTENNFEDAGAGALFVNAPLYETLYKIRGIVNQSWTQYFKDYRVIEASHFRHNYWGKPSLIPHPIFGFTMFWILLVVIHEGGFPNRVAFDWRPALTPFQPY
jgi:nitrous oxidase accessory protein NosD